MKRTLERNRFQVSPWRDKGFVLSLKGGSSYLLLALGAFFIKDIIGKRTKPKDIEKSPERKLV